MPNESGDLKLLANFRSPRPVRQLALPGRQFSRKHRAAGEGICEGRVRYEQSAVQTDQGVRVQAQAKVTAPRTCGSAADPVRKGLPFRAGA